MKRTDDIIDKRAKLFEIYYKVRVVYFQTLSIDEIRRNGIPITGIKQVDDDYAKQWQTRYMTPAMMFSLHKDGCDIRVPSEKDLHEIYRHIQEYLYEWRGRLRNAVNIGESPLDDLRGMDEFAKVVFDQASFTAQEDSISDSFLIQQMNKIQKGTVSRLLNSKDKPTIASREINHDVTFVDNGDPEPSAPTRDSLADFFTDRMVSFRG